jgi:hypothetical protein
MKLGKKPMFIGVVILSVVAMVCAVWWQNAKVKAERLRNDLRAFHLWAVETVDAARTIGGSIPLNIVEYLVELANREWAVTVGIPDEEVKLIERAERHGFQPLMRLQVSLAPAQRDYFLERCKMDRL